MSYDVLVIGGGPAGLSASINVRARGRSALVVSNPLEENPLWRAEKVDNYLGLPGLSGAEMLAAMRRHAEQAGVEFLAENGGHGFEKQYDARYFQAARSRSAAAADEHEYEQYDLGKMGPRFKVVRNKSRGGRKRRRGKKRFQQCGRGVQSAFQH